MAFIQSAIVAFIAVMHIYFLILEMFFWTKPLGMKIFSNKPEFAESTRVLAANQGLYNGFLAAGLIWSLVAPQEMGQSLALFFLVCVFIAGTYGGYSANKKIFFIQGLPALIGLFLIILNL